MRKTWQQNSKRRVADVVDGVDDIVANGRRGELEPVADAEGVLDVQRGFESAAKGWRSPMHGATDAARSSRFIVPKIIGDHVFKRCPHALNCYFTRPNGDEADATAAVVFER